MAGTGMTSSGMIGAPSVGGGWGQQGAGEGIRSQNTLGPAGRLHLILLRICAETMVRRNRGQKHAMSGVRKVTTLHA